MNQAPNFLIIGAMKSGTTSLFHYMKQHPSIVMPQHKESHYFDFHYDKISIDSYISSFPLRSNSILSGEATPRYIFHPLVAQRVYSVFPKIKIIIILRNPTDRAYSHYNMCLRNKKEHKTFDYLIKQERAWMEKNSWENYVVKQKTLGRKRILFLSRGHYLKQIKNWLKWFSINQIHILYSEDLLKNHIVELNKLTHFLKIDPFDDSIKKHNLFKGNYSDMDTTTRQWLNNYYRPYNERLFEFLKTEQRW